MALRVRFQYPTGEQLGVSIERLADGLLYDFMAGAFNAAPASLTAPLTESSGFFRGRYALTMASTPVAQFKDGDYCVTVHDMVRLAAKESCVVAELACTMHNGDDATYLASLAGTWQIGQAPAAPTPLPSTIPTGP